MKHCPKCRKTYADETLNFCLDDGVALEAAAGAEPPPTVVIPDPRESARNQQLPTQRFNEEVRTSPRYEVPRPAKSRTWLWVLGILAGIGLLCGGGFFGLVLIGTFAGKDEPETVPSDTSRKVRESRSDGDPSRRLVSEDDFSFWKVEENEFISSERRNNALVLTSVDDYYYVILTENKRTFDASTKLTVRNVSGDRVSLGYGLVVHSYPDAVFEDDFAFLIRSDNGTYRIVRHLDKEEKPLTDWTKSDAINRGTSANDLEVRAKGKEMEFFINGKFVKRLSADSIYERGVAGIYTSDDAPIAFSKLEIRK